MSKGKAELLAHGVDHLDILVDKNQKNKALAVFTERRKLDHSFLPAADPLFKVAGWLNETGKTKAAMAVYNLIVKSCPENPLAPKAYFRVAQIFNDRLMSTEKSKKVLSVIITKYPNHDIMPMLIIFWHGSD
jgi:TolA-binding protein